MANVFKHFFLKDNAQSDKYKTPKITPIQPKIPSRNRVSHARKLLREFEQIWEEKRLNDEQRQAASIPSTDGTYVEFTSKADHDLISKSLESISKGIRLLNIRETLDIDEAVITKALVYIPRGQESYFVKKIRAFQTENVKGTSNPKNNALVCSIEDVHLALLETLWTDNLKLLPKQTATWCEVWVNINTGEDTDVQITEFLSTLNIIEIDYKPNAIVFPERAVLLIKANKKQLVELMMQSDKLAELRAGQETASFWMKETSVGQDAWAEDLIKRLEFDNDSKIKVCILDTGVNNGHKIIQPILSNQDTLTVNSIWGTNDHDPKSGHGTLMAGIVGYGNFEEELAHNNKVLITHKLCSVKILPPPGQPETPKELWGDITSRAISIAEIQNPEKVLLYCMAVASPDDVEKGRPSSWSGAVDNLAFGEGKNQRLIIVSAGNVHGDELWLNYPNSNFVSSVLNPAQAWNALVVGAYTNKTVVKDTKYQNHQPLASVNQLSPYSTTSLVWEKRWPIKPDIVFEGGNLLKSPQNTIVAHSDLDLLSTSKNFTLRPFDTFCATSAATAQASWFAAKLAHAYPEAWPETIRALIVHSASWPNSMIQQMNVQNGNKSEYNKLTKVFGYGVPDLNKALYSTEGTLTYIAQERIQPFSYKIENGGKTSTPETNEIHTYQLPWPKDVLLSMGNIPVKLRITLSYFVEPGLGEIGWKDKYRYQSFGLRFDVNKRGEEPEDFKKRLNKLAREENEIVSGESDSDRWLIGSNFRSNGSIHSDVWNAGTAADLATCNMIGIYPVIGWWRERKHLKRVEDVGRYSLVVSLETPTEEFQLYSTVKALIDIPISIKATTK